MRHRARHELQDDAAAGAEIPPRGGAGAGERQRRQERRQGRSRIERRPRRAGDGRQRDAADDGPCRRRQGEAPSTQAARRAFAAWQPVAPMLAPDWPFSPQRTTAMLRHANRRPHAPVARRRMVGSRWQRRLRLRLRRPRPHPALPRPPARRRHAADRAGGAGERHRGLGRDRRRALRPQQPLLRAWHPPPRRRRPRRRLLGRALALLALPVARRHRAGAQRVRGPGRRRDGAALAGRPHGAPHGAPAALRAGLPRAAPREPGVRLHDPARGGRPRVAALPRVAGHHRARQLRLG